VLSSPSPSTLAYSTSFGPLCDQDLTQPLQERVPCASTGRHGIWTLMGAQWRQWVRGEEV
jgi:hypothetical protein